MIKISLSPVSLSAGLYIIATPIGHLKDISLRALETLMSVDIILCEDTRVSQKLLAAYGISKKLMSLHDHNEQQKAAYILELITQGQSLALISDAGTPLISDPGYKLVQFLSSHDVFITHLPGPSSLNTAMVLSALPTDRFTFVGFAPAKTSSRLSFLQDLKNMSSTIIMLESPHRIIACLADISQVFGASHPIALCRELTKRYEEVLRMNAQDLYEYAQKKQGFKGEITLVVAPFHSHDELSEDHIAHLLTEALKNYRLKDAAHLVSEQTGISKKELYNKALKLKDI